MNTQDIVFVAFNENDFITKAMLPDSGCEAIFNLKKLPEQTVLIRPISIKDGRTVFEVMDDPGKTIELKRYSTIKTDGGSVWILPFRGFFHSLRMIYRAETRHLTLKRKLLIDR